MILTDVMRRTWRWRQSQKVTQRSIMWVCVGDAFNIEIISICLIRIRPNRRELFNNIFSKQSAPF